MTRVVTEHSEEPAPPAHQNSGWVAYNASAREMRDARRMAWLVARTTTAAAAATAAASQDG